MATRETYDGAGNVIATETIPDPVVALFPLDLLALFTPSELLAIEQSTNLSVVAFRTQFFAALNPIELTDARLLGAISVMESIGILTQSRAQAVRENRTPE